MLKGVINSDRIIRATNPCCITIDGFDRTFMNIDLILDYVNQSDLDIY